MERFLENRFSVQKQERRIRKSSTTTHVRTRGIQRDGSGKSLMVPRTGIAWIARKRLLTHQEAGNATQFKSLPVNITRRLEVPFSALPKQFGAEIGLNHVKSLA